MKRICRLFFLFQCLLDGGVWSLRNLSISVPRAVLSGEGQSALLRCSYDLEGAALYSIRWYRAEDEFYRYVPREMPPTMVFPLPGASVDLAQSDHQQVRIVNMNRRLSGDYQCEVSADAPLFHTDIRSAPLTVVGDTNPTSPAVIAEDGTNPIMNLNDRGKNEEQMHELQDPPFRAPRLQISRLIYERNDILHANCSVDEAYPAPNITWTIDGHKIAETISWQTSEQDFKERSAFSQLEITILETDHYKLEHTYTQDSPSYYKNHFSRNIEADSTKRDVLRFTMTPPPSGHFAISCVATIYDIYARSSDLVHVKEDSPRPASVTGEDSSGFKMICDVMLTLFCACASLVHTTL